jgi:hypothetical protein
VPSSSAGTKLPGGLACLSSFLHPVAYPLRPSVPPRASIPMGKARINLAGRLSQPLDLEIRLADLARTDVSCVCAEVVMLEEPGRRRFPRFTIHLPLIYAPQAPWPTSLGAGWTRSLSEGGATVELSGRLRPRTPLRLLLKTGQAPIEVEALVVWTGGRVPEGGGLVHGLAFTEIGPDQVVALREMFPGPSIIRNAGVRIPLDAPVTCHPRNPDGPPLQGRTGNVSRGGLFIRLPRLLSPGTAMEVTLHASREPVILHGSVVWVEPPEIWNPGESIGHGLRFTDLDWSTLFSLALLLVERS